MFWAVLLITLLLFFTKIWSQPKNDDINTCCLGSSLVHCMRTPKFYILSYTNYWSNYESYFTSHYFCLILHVSGTYMRKWYLNLFICMKKVVTKGNLSDYEESSRPTALSRLCITCWMIFKIFHCSHQEPIFLLSFVSISRIPHCIYLLAVIAKWLTVLKFSWEDSPEMK